MDSETSENFIFGALIGGAIGATAALILAPMSGVNLRKKITNSLNSSPSSSGKSKARKTSSSDYDNYSRDHQVHARRSSGIASRKMKEEHKPEKKPSTTTAHQSRSRTSTQGKSSSHKPHR